MKLHLYFLDNENNYHLVTDNITPDSPVLMDLVLQDLMDRRPGFTSFYQRTWFDDKGRYWIDYGSHTEFYVLQDWTVKENNEDEYH